MADSAISSAVHGLGRLVDEANSLRGVTDKILQLQYRLRRLHCFLRDADTRQTDDSRVSEWVAEIRECAYDAEDVIWHFKGKVSSESGKHKILKLLRSLACAMNQAVHLHKVGSRIDAIGARITNLSTDLHVLGIKQIEPREGYARLVHTDGGTRRTYSHSEETALVELDHHIARLVEELADDAKICSVVSICGMAGVGKTTLGRMVYYHTEVRKHFDCFAWAYIYQEWQVREVLEGILIGLTSPTSEKRKEICNKRDEEIVKDIHHLQLQRRCLVVLDNIRTVEAWNGVAEAFPHGRSGSKILLTSSNKQVCLHANPQGYIHELGCLKEDNSWKLLRILCFPNDGVQRDKQMENLGRQMLEYCGGLPLAVVAIGKILATKHTLDEWKMVKENVKTYLRKGEGVNQEKTSVISTLSLSYEELPYQLKPCFLYLGHFPKDHEIQARSLIWMWEAEGFIYEEDGEDGKESLDDVAERYLYELEKRYMLRLRMDEETRQVKSCKLHNLMHNLCVLEAKKENFLRAMHLQGAEPMIGPPPASSSSSSTARDRRLSIQLSQAKGRVKVNQQYKRIHHVRSLIIFHKYCGPETLALPLKSFKSLRVLHLEGSTWLPGLLDEIGYLLQLTYLGIKVDQVDSLPYSIGNLCCLQTLNIQARRVDCIPNVLWKLKQLRHLHLPQEYHQIYGDPLYMILNSSTAKRELLQLNTLTSLETLHNLKSVASNNDSLPHPNNLHELSVQILRLRDVSAIMDFLNSSSHLRRLSLGIRGEIAAHNHMTAIKQLWSYNYLHELEIETPLRELPRNHLISPNLTKLRLWNCRLTKDPMIELEKLPNLRILALHFNSFLGKKMVSSDKGFPHLRLLELRELSNLEEWNVEDGAMSSLHCLEILGCTQLRIIPDGLKFVITLRELRIIEMPAHFERRVKAVDGRGRGGEDLYKVKHVPSISFIVD